MKPISRLVAVGVLAVSTAVLPVAGPSAAALPNDDATIVHVLNRIGFGPRTGDVERIRSLGLQHYIDQQLHPERISDATLAVRLAAMPTISMSSRQIARDFERPMLEARRERKNGRESGDQADPQQREMQKHANQVVTELAQAEDAARGLQRAAARRKC